MDAKTQAKLKKFLKDREVVINPKDIALIILGEEDDLSNRDWEKLYSSTSYFLLDNAFEFQKVVNKFIETQKEGKILLLEMKVNPDPRLIQLLKEISEFGSFNLHDERGNLTNNLKVKPGSLVVIARRSFIEEGITYPRFYDIFSTAFDTTFNIKK